MGELLNVSEIARYLKVTPATIYRLLKKGRIPAFRVGGNWRFNLEAIDKWMREGEASPNSALSGQARGDIGGTVSDED
jgi:excisionase family DNA binding protein